MAPILVASNTFGFADGNLGHVCDLGFAPNVGETDIFCMNSDTVVSTPAGFQLRRQEVTNQGAYIASRKAAGGEGQTVTVVTAGNFHCLVSWSRWANLDLFDSAAGAQLNSNIGGSTPPVSTGPLGADQELVIAFGAMHSIGSGNQNTPVWASGFSPLTTGKQALGPNAVLAFVGYKLGVGPGAEAPQVSWSGDGCFERYILTAAFTSVAEIPIEPAEPDLFIRTGAPVVRVEGSTPLVVVRAADITIEV